MQWQGGWRGGRLWSPRSFLCSSTLCPLCSCHQNSLVTFGAPRLDCANSLLDCEKLFPMSGPSPCCSHLCTGRPPSSLRPQLKVTSSEAMLTVSFIASVFVYLITVHLLPAENKSLYHICIIPDYIRAQCLGQRWNIPGMQKEEGGGNRKTVWFGGKTEARVTLCPGIWGPQRWYPHPHILYFNSALVALKKNDEWDGAKSPLTTGKLGEGGENAF